MAAITRNAGVFATAPRHDARDLADRLFAVPAQWAARYTLRRKLAVMDDYLLRDIGWEPSDARIEADKPFWKA
ncbi:MAG: DUF1127 domain-containing protein [Pseudomonadota bacterium]